MTNFKLTVQYDGTRFSGWQKQGNTDNTIQGKLENILNKMTAFMQDLTQKENITDILLTMVRWQMFLSESI